MLNILFGFLPWILYFVIINSSHFAAEIAALTALIATIIIDGKGLRKKFILVWGTFIYFVFLCLMYILPWREWFVHYASLLSNVMLSLIMWFSLLIKKPFTLQYAREQVDKAAWDSPLFIRINYFLTTMWSIVTSLIAGISFLQSSKIITSNWSVNAMQIALSIFAIYFTKWYPDWYQGYLFRKESKSLEDIAKNPFLNGNFAPVHDELMVENLVVIGKIPDDLQGIYMRNGPNPAFHPISYTYPFDGDGMLHAIYLNDGEAEYRNRFIETKGLLAERKTGHALYGGVMKPIPTDPKLIGKVGDQGPIKNGAFIHIIKHANQYLAMWEAGPAYQVDNKLQTIGEWYPANVKSPFNINAHTRYDASTGELHAFSYDWQPPYLNYYVINKNGELIKNIPIDKPYGSMMHDFVLTKNYVIFFDCPAVVNMKQMQLTGKMISWQPHLGVRIGILNRSNDKIIWLETEPFFVFHFANAYEKDNIIIVDYVRYKNIFSEKQSEKNNPALYRTEINIYTKKITHRQLDDRFVEFPRINEVANNNFHRYIYTPTRLHDSESFTALLKYDSEKQQTFIHDFGVNTEIGEAVFAPSLSGAGEDSGYVMLFVYNKIEKNSDFVILNAADFTAEPLAKIKLPRRVPHGLHGSWFPY